VLRCEDFTPPPKSCSFIDSFFWDSRLRFMRRVHTKARKAMQPTAKAPNTDAAAMEAGPIPEPEGELVCVAEAAGAVADAVVDVDDVVDDVDDVDVVDVVVDVVEVLVDVDDDEVVEAVVEPLVELFVDGAPVVVVGWGAGGVGFAGVGVASLGGGFVLGGSSVVMITMFEESCVGSGSGVLSGGGLSGGASSLRLSPSAHRKSILFLSVLQSSASQRSCSPAATEVQRSRITHFSRRWAAREGLLHRLSSASCDA
jgi:hypothetical protein